MQEVLVVRLVEVRTAIREHLALAKKLQEDAYTPVYRGLVATESELLRALDYPDPQRRSTPNLQRVLVADGALGRRADDSMSHLERTPQRR